MLAEVYLLKVHLISFLTPHNLYKINKKTHTHTHTHKQVPHDRVRVKIGWSAWNMLITMRIKMHHCVHEDI
jgi:hypothetical protein